MAANITRKINLPRDHSFFLFGARGVGKSTIIDKRFSKNSISINLLLNKEEQLYSRNPDHLITIVEELPKEIQYIFIDEIQKIPKLLDNVHYLIEKTNKIFLLTGSSARKLKKGGANLLAGRAFTYNLHPFTSLELDDSFKLQDALEWGLLPKIYSLNNAKSKMEYLETYAHTYLKEEIWAEQFISKLDPFRSFLEVAAQMNGKIINFSKIAKDVGVEDLTIKNYYSILEDTLIGFFLNAYKHSFRKRLSTKPKFYFFDTGVCRALSRTLSVQLQESTSAYGHAFEHFIILECMKLASYFKYSYRFSYLKTKDDAEIDLVVERPGKPILFIEIKSAEHIEKRHLSTFIKLSEDFDEEHEAICLCRTKLKYKIENVKVLPWQEGIKEYFYGEDERQ